MKYDLSNVRLIMSGAAPLGSETIADIRKVWPKWKVGQGYGKVSVHRRFEDRRNLRWEADLYSSLGLTESSPGVCTTSENDLLPGSSGCILPDTRCKLIDMAGNEITELEKPGELWVQSPSVFLGYLNDAKATAETITWDTDGRWLRTGDEVLVRKSPLGNEHLVVVDRIKELIKTKVWVLFLAIQDHAGSLTIWQGFQVSPAEIEDLLLIHPFVADCAVIPVPDSYDGEVPKAFVVKEEAHASADNAEVAAAICKYVKEHKARYKWLKGGVEFVSRIPKSASGKTLRRLLRDQEKNKRTATPKL